MKSTGKQSKKERRNKRGGRKSEAKNEKNSPQRKRDPLKWQKSDKEMDNTQEEGKKLYSAHPEMVERVIISDKEMIKFDFTKSDQLGGEKVCDISLSIIDGMGVEYTDEFKIQNNYQEILDVNAAKRCAYKKNVIQGVQIKDGVAQLQLKLRKTFNRSLKFIYYVEV